MKQGDETLPDLTRIDREFPIGTAEQSGHELDLGDDKAINNTAHLLFFFQNREERHCFRLVPRSRHILDTGEEESIRGKEILDLPGALSRSAWKRKKHRQRNAKENHDRAARTTSCYDKIHHNLLADRSRS